MSRKHRRTVWAVLVAAFLVYAVPVAKNLYVHWQYIHDGDAMTRISGEPGSLPGLWEITFDHFECTHEVRVNKRLEIGTDGSGHLHTRYYFVRIGDTYSFPYSWASVLPWSHESSLESIASVVDSLGTLVVTEQPAWSEGQEYTDYFAYKIRGDRLYLGYSGGVGQEPRFWGLGGMWRLELRDLLRPWFWCVIPGTCAPRNP